jgi:hypothetical protein
MASRTTSPEAQSCHARISTDVSAFAEASEKFQGHTAPASKRPHDLSEVDAAPSLLMEKSMSLMAKGFGGYVSDFSTPTMKNA